MTRYLPILFSCLALPLTLTPVSDLRAQEAERWFQIEVSIFSNENLADRASEQWAPSSTSLSYPGTIRRLQSLLDLFMLEELRPESSNAATFVDAPATTIPAAPTLHAQIAATGPFPAKPRGDFRFLDFARDAFVQLPNSESAFVQTNRAIERSPEHRLLFHGLWRQPVFGAGRATPLYIQGGLNYGDQNELQGALTIRFNQNADRVVVDADLWLSEFSIVGTTETDWQLPPVPTRLRRVYDATDSGSELNYQIQRIYRLQQSRDMRSTEFHYIDHPALGLVILVNPYEVPPAPAPELNLSLEDAQ